MQVTTIPPVDPAAVRAAAGYDPRGTWASPIHQRPGAFKGLQGNPRPDLADHMDGRA